MKQSKNTKRALTASILSMIVCCAMLIGSTFAWFTDSVTSGNNKIVAGNLDVAMEWRDGKEDPSAAEGWQDASGTAIFSYDLDSVTSGNNKIVAGNLDVAMEWRDGKEDPSAAEGWQDASGTAIFSYDLWEPGYTEARHVRISNKGNLALKYEIRIAANGEVSKLADVIDVYYIKGGRQLTGRADLTDENKIGTLKEVLANPAAATGHLSKDGKDVATIALKMQEGAGNEYQGESIGTDFTIQLVATQYTEENDSFDNQYDKDATIALKMQEGAGNEYQGESIGTDFTIQLVATQYTEENDSFDNQYDKDAAIPSSGKVLVDALNNPDIKEITVGESIILGEGAYAGSNGNQNLAVLTDKDIDFANQTLTRPMNGSGNGFMIGNDNTPVTVNVTNGNFISDDGQRLIQVSAGSTVTFKDSKFTAAGGDKIVTLNLKPNDLTTTVVFENCEFDKAAVEIAGRSGGTSNVNVQFINCTFTNLKPNDLTTTVVFENCEFDKAAVEIAGRSGGTSNVNVQFINCTFTGTTLEKVAPEHADNHKYGTYAGYYTTSQLIATNSYISGNVGFDDCKFNWNGPADLGKSKTSEVFENYGAVYTLKDCTVTVTNSNGQTKIFASENANKLKFEGTNTFYVDGIEVDYKGAAK